MKAVVVQLLNCRLVRKQLIQVSRITIRIYSLICVCFVRPMVVNGWGFAAAGLLALHPAIANPLLAAALPHLKAEIGIIVFHTNPKCSQLLFPQPGSPHKKWLLPSKIFTSSRLFLSLYLFAIVLVSDGEKILSLPPPINNTGSCGLLKSILEKSIPING